MVVVLLQWWWRVADHVGWQQAVGSVGFRRRVLLAVPGRRASVVSQTDKISRNIQKILKPYVDNYVRWVRLRQVDALSGAAVL